MKISLDNIDAFIFDFDGVLTNNLVYLNQDGQEWVACSRSDGIAFDVLRKLGKPAYILSTEINHKCCKDVVKTILPLANRCYIRVCKIVTIEWE